MKLKFALAAATAMALPLAAQAQPVTGLYIGAGAGVNFLMNQHMSASTGWFDLPSAWRGASDGSGLVRGSVDSQSRKPGFAGVISAGWGFGNGLRAEIEGSWRNAGIRGRNFRGSMSDGDGDTYAMNGGGYLRGNSNQYAVMVNALYDFNGISPMFVPYIGAGVGYSWQNFHGLRAGGGGDLEPYGRHAGLGFSSDSTVGAFAYQAIVGAAIPLAAIPGLSLTAEYRFLGTAGSQTLSGDGHGGGNIRYDGREGGGRDFRSAKVDESYNHSILLGVRYEFNKAPAPAPVAAAAPVPPARSFMVFFDWDRFNLTDRARAVIRDAATTSKSVQHTRVEVNGYADTSGNPRYNMGLSMKRAQTVAAELVRNGVAKNEIVIKAFGDTVLLVPTGPGVREPQNRRVEIIIR